MVDSGLREWKLRVASCGEVDVRSRLILATDYIILPGTVGSTAGMTVLMLTRCAAICTCT